jgi:ketosteroid isomerase-like protein
MADLDSSVARILAAYSAAVDARNVDALMRLYDPKVAVEGWFTTLATEPMKARFEEVQTSGSSDHAAVTAFVHYASFSTTGEPLRSMHNRISWVLRTSGHVLRIVHEHTSAPMGFEDMKAIVERKTGA